MPRTCALCGKELKGIFKNQHLGMDFCADCFGYVTLFCHSPEDVGRFSIDQLKAIHKKDICDLCGQHVSPARKKFICDGIIHGVTADLRDVRDVYLTNPQFLSELPRQV